MIYVVIDKLEGAKSVCILRICTLSEEMYKGDRLRRNYELHPECTSFEEASEIAHRIVKCTDGTERPRIFCSISKRGFVPRSPGSRKAKPESIAKLKQYQNTAEGKAEARKVMQAYIFRNNV